MKYYVTIEEMVSQRFKIDANSMEEAIKVAEEKYNKGELVLTPGVLVAKQMYAENESGTEATEWMEF